VCALAEEARAFLDVVSEQCQTTFVLRTSPHYGYDYRFATIQNNKREALRLHVSWLPRYGPQEMVLHLTHVLEEYAPRFAAMTGICAGDRVRISLGDLVVTERTYTYDSGKFVIDERERTVHKHDTMTYHLDENILRFVPLFEQWKPLVKQLTRPPSKRQQREWLLNQLLDEQTPSVQMIPVAKRERHAPAWRRIVHELQQGPDPLLTPSLTLQEKSRVEQMRYGLDPFPYTDPREVRCHIKPMASGSAVRSDNPFKDIQVPVRGTVAIDMEGAAFCRTMASFPGIRWLVVKGVSDYADRDKDDSYHPYASSASARYLLCFLKEYITQDRLPALYQHASLSQGSRSPVWNVPYGRNPFFTGREDLLQQLHDRLMTHRSAVLTQAQAVSGLGGIGKTQTAVEYAYRYQQAYQYVLWIRAATRATLTADFVTIAGLLHLPEQDEQDQARVVAAVRNWLAHHSGWLLIFDNADDLNMSGEFLPMRGEGHILLTTRAQATGTIAEPIKVEKMGEDEGSLLLLRRSKILAPGAPLDQATQAERASAEAIVVTLDMLPLAIDQAGAYIEETGCSFADYLALYSIGRKELLGRRGQLASYHPDSVVTTFSLTFQQVEQTNPAAAELLRLCAFLAPDAIPEEILGAGAAELGDILGPEIANPFKLNEALEVVRRYSLVQRHAETKILSIHRLVQAVLIDTMDEQTQQRWAERTVRMTNTMFPTIDGVKRQPGQRYISHAQACAKLIDQWSMKHAEAARLLHEAGSYFYTVAQYEQAEPLFKRALQIREHVLGTEHPAVAASLNNLALLYQAQGKYEQAEPLLRHALEIVEQAGGPEDLRVSKSLNNLAAVYKVGRKYEQAESLLWRALQIDERSFGPEHPEVATDLNNLTELYFVQGRYEQAEVLCLRALAIREHLLGPKHPHTISSYNNLALIYHKHGKYQQAESLYLQILPIFEEAYGSTHPELALSLSNLASFYEDVGKYEEAKLLYDCAHVA
jgi:tetratricopeptide (TPR) repeat protein/nucleoside phosphorylase